MEQNNIKEYIALTKNRPSLFKGDSLTIIKDPITLHNYQKKSGQKLGIVYQSSYHTVVVDLVKDYDGRIFPYERIIPTTPSQGVVLIPFYEGKFVLLKQFRHAIQDFQFSFPRGFGEDGITPKENAEKELFEELGATWNTINFLGNVTGDSGLSSDKSCVFFGEISLPNPTFGNEGIENIYYLNSKQIKEWVARNEIEDGFTLSALALYWESLV